ncbi:12394_t:CDS:1, partial [Racocetra fulgida]
NRHERRFGRIEAIVSFLPPSETIDPNNQMQDALKISRLLRHDELGIYCSKDRSLRGHKELWMIKEDYQIVSPIHILKHVFI